MMFSCENKLCQKYEKFTNFKKKAYFKNVFPICKYGPQLYFKFYFLL